MKKTLIVLLAALLVLGCTVALADDFNPVCELCHANPANAYLSCSGGDYVYYCPACAVGAGIKAGTTKAEHKWNYYGEKDVAATCTTAGYEDWKCEICGAREMKEVEAPLGHKFDSTPVVISVATCTKPGTESITCSRGNCPKDGSHVIYNQIPALGHVYAGDKDYSDGNVDNAVKAYIAENDPTPDEFGNYWYGLSKPGLYVKPNCMTAGGAVVYCYRCDAQHKVALSKTAHVWDPSHSVTTNSTCIKYGSTKRICQICGQIVTEKLPLARHTWAKNDKATGVTYVTGNEWFPLGDNMAYKKCTVCGQYEVYADFDTTPYLVGITKGKPAENIGTLTDNNPSMTQPNKDNVKGAKKASTAAAKASAASTKANANGVSIPATNDTTSTVPFVMMGIALVGIVALIASKRKVNG